jgi:23S rRNA (pseudouridine1915-N3)-methyltransferase
MLRLLLLAATARQPAWVDEGFRHYATRLRGRCKLELKPIRLARRGTSVPTDRTVAEEGSRMLAAIPLDAHVVALAEAGKPWTTQQLATKLERWMTQGAPVCLLIGGPDGLAPDCLARANEGWSLSPLTLPHGLARVIVAEALYRAWSILEHHPYHRG